MSTVTVTIVDTPTGIDMQGEIDNPNAFNEPPTAALVIGSYLAANAERVIADATTWFKEKILAPERDEDVEKLIVPGRPQ